MSRSNLLWGLALSLGVALGGAAESRAAAVWSVLTVQTDGDPQPWLDLMKKAQANRKRLGLPDLTVVSAQFAGDAVGVFYVSVEYPSLAAYAAAVDKMNADGGSQATLRELQGLKSARLVGSSLYVDRTPAGVETTPLPAGGWSTGLAVRVDGDAAGYLAVISKLAAHNKRLGGPQPRVWQATAAGANTGTLLVTLAYPSLAALEESQAKVSADPAWAGLMAEVTATGRKVLGSVLVRDRTPR